MIEELDALHQNPRESHMYVAGSKWVFTMKLNANGTLNRLKARLVVKGQHQVDGIDYTETLSPVIKPGMIRLVFSLAIVEKGDIRQLDVKKLLSMVL